MLATKTKEHIRRAVAARGPRWLTLVCAGAALCGTVAFVDRTMRVVEISDSHGNYGVTITAAEDINTLMRQTGIPAPDGADELQITEDDGHDRIHILRAYTVPITADGETVEEVTTGGTVAEVLAAAGVNVGPDDIVTPASDEAAPQGTEITVQRVTYNDYTVEEPVEVETQYLYTSLFYRDQNAEMLVQEGTPGTERVTYHETYIDGEWASTEEAGRETVTEMVPTVLKVYGEGAPVSEYTGPEVADGVPVEGVTAVYTGRRSTGYSASQTARGASGRRLIYGSVAVNPNTIPYGTLMYITSDDGRFVYGYAYAADTGGAMLSGSAFIDLYYETYDEAVESAVIPVTVYVIDDEVAAAYQEANDAVLQAHIDEVAASGEG